MKGQWWRLYWLWDLQPVWTDKTRLTARTLRRRAVIGCHLSPVWTVAMGRAHGAIEGDWEFRVWALNLGAWFIGVCKDNCRE